MDVSLLAMQQVRQLGHVRHRGKVVAAIEGVVRALAIGIGLGGKAAFKIARPCGDVAVGVGLRMARAVGVVGVVRDLTQRVGDRHEVALRVVAVARGVALPIRDGAQAKAIPRVLVAVIRVRADAGILTA